MNIIILVTMFLMLSFWAYCNLFYMQKTLPTAYGYVIYAIFQWLIIVTNLVRMFGWATGLISFFVVFAFGAVLVTNFTTKHLYYLIFKNNPLVPLALFCHLVHINAILAVIAFFV